MQRIRIQTAEGEVLNQICVGIEQTQLGPFVVFDDEKAYKAYCGVYRELTEEDPASYAVLGVGVAAELLDQTDCYTVRISESKY